MVASKASRREGAEATSSYLIGLPKPSTRVFLDGSRNKENRDSKKHRYFARCLNIASNIASALDYMHSWNVIYRDLKPENVGFDVNDEVKIFDFGFTKELREADSLDDGLYNLTGNTGSPRYMAPEVGRSMPYNLSAD
eukprot:14643431-Ditylum_brightwellii.AAC.1